MRRYRHFVVLGLYVVLTLLVTLPVVGSFTTNVIGQGGDPWQTLWRFEHTAQVLRHAWQEGQVLPYLWQQFGGGAPQLVNLTVWPWIPLHFLLGQPLTYNLVWVLSFVLSGYAMYLLASWLFRGDQTTESKGWMAEAPAFLAGLFYMFLPYHVAHAYGHFGALQTQWIPLAILALLSWFRKPTLGRAVLAGVVIGMQAWSEHHYTLWLALFVIVLVVASWRQWRTIRIKAVVPSGILLAGLLVVLVIIPYWPTIQFSQLSSSLHVTTADISRFSADPFGYVVPALFHPLWGKVVALLFAPAHVAAVSETTHFIGWLPLLLLLFFHQRIPRQQKYFWITVAGIFIVISLGSRLHLLGLTTGIPLPYALLDQLPIFSAVRAVGRAAIVANVALAVLLGWVLRTNLKRPSGVLIVGGVILIEFLCMPLPLFPPTVSPLYSQIRSFPGERIIELPAATNYVAASQALYGSLHHDKEVVGNIALERAALSLTMPDPRSVPALRKILYLRTTDLTEDRLEFFGQSLGETMSDVFAWLKIGGVVIHTDSLNNRQTMAVTDFLEHRLVLSPQIDGELAVYRFDAAASTLPKHDGVLFMRGSGWGTVGYDQAHTRYFAQLPEVATVDVIVTEAQPKRLKLMWQVAADSPAGVALRHEDRFIAAARPGEKSEVTIDVTSPSTTLHFSSSGPGTALIQDPHFEVLP